METDVDPECTTCGLRRNSGCVCAPRDPAADECQRCGLEWWGCICDPSRPNRQPTEAEIHAAREARLVRAEREPAR